MNYEQPTPEETLAIAREWLRGRGVRVGDKPPSVELFSRILVRINRGYNRPWAIVRWVENAILQLEANHDQSPLRHRGA